MPADPSLTRRTTLVAGVASGALVVGGCRLDPSGPGSAASSGADPDERIVASARHELTVLLAVCAHPDRSVPDQARTALAAAHRAQLVALGGKPPRHVGSPSARGDLRQRELTGQRRLARWADQAQSGALARLLASASASIAAGLVAHG